MMWKPVRSIPIVCISVLLALAFSVQAAFAAEETPAGQKTESTKEKPAQAEEKASPDQGKAQDKPMYGKWGVETGNFSKTVSPGDDFYVYVNEGWLNSTEIPQGFPRIDSFVDVHLRTEGQINSIMDDIKAGKTEGLTGGEQVKAFYESYMDEARIEELVPARGKARRRAPVDLG